MSGRIVAVAVDPDSGDAGRRDRARGRAEGAEDRRRRGDDRGRDDHDCRDDSGQTGAAAATCGREDPFDSEDASPATRSSPRVRLRRSVRDLDNLAADARRRTAARSRSTPSSRSRTRPLTPSRLPERRDALVRGRSRDKQVGDLVGLRHERRLRARGQASGLSLTRRRGRDLNPRRTPQARTRFPVALLRPLGHLSAASLAYARLYGSPGSRRAGPRLSMLRDEGGENELASLAGVGRVRGGGGPDRVRIAVIALALNGRSTVHNGLKDEKIMGTPDMTPAAIKEEAAQAGLQGHVVAVVLGCRQGRRQRRPRALLRAVHADPRAGGDRRPGLRRDAALRDGRRQGDERRGQGEQGAERPSARQPGAAIWITETALSTALNVSYMADQLALFSLVVGIALLLAGVGFIILAAGGALRRSTAAAAPRPEVAPAS